MESTPVKTEDATLKSTEDEVTAVLIHLTKLLRIKNRLCSPLLQLPIETIIHIISFLMEAIVQYCVWQPIFSTCHHIRRIMRTATELWWKVDCEQTRVAHIAFARSKGNPQAIVADLNPWRDWQNEKARKALDYWRRKQVLHGYRLHTLELSGVPSDMDHFSWIFERPLPRLHCLKIRFFGPLTDDEDESQLPIPSPVALQLPMDLPLKTLDLNNATLPWSSSLFAGLRELRMDFRDCETVVEISPDELLGVFDASPQLESVSLIQVRPRIPLRDGEPQYVPTRIAQLPNLAFLKLDNFPEFAGYTLLHMNIPAIDFLEIRSHVFPFEVSWSLRFFFVNHRLSRRIFPNPSVFGIRVADEDDMSGSVHVAIGGFKMWFDFDEDVAETVYDAITTCVPPMVPPSVAILKLGNIKLDERAWKEFFRSHPEVRAIECSDSSRESVFNSLWDALSPSGTDEGPLCQKLESISLDGPTSAPLLLGCLVNRKNAGFGLRHLRFRELDDGLVEEFRLLVEELQVFFAPDSFDLRMVRPVLTNEPGPHVLTETPSGNSGVI